MCKNFLWSGFCDRKVIPLVAWKQICLPKNEGGLGMKQIRAWNVAAIAKNLWNICLHKETLWVRWIHQIYIKGSSIWDLQEPQDCSWSLRKILQIRDIFRDHIKVSIGDGTQTLLFHDNWLGDARLADREGIKDHFCTWGRYITVSSWWDGEWKIPSSLERRFGEIAIQIQQHHLTPVPDRVVSTDSKAGTFTISSAYDIL